MLARLAMPMADLFNLRVQTIVIDPGHGGIDPGATGHQGLKEKDVALDIALRLRDKLSESGKYRILLTREKDRKVFLKERVAFAKENRADLFISIHINSLPPGASALNYVETYYFGPHTDQRSLQLAEKENRDSDYAMGDFREVIARIGDTLKTEESRELANSIHRRLYSNLRRRNPGLIDAGSKTGPFMVLLGVDVPSVLVEVSCISNKAEETRLSMPEYRDGVAGFLEAGIVEYLEQRAERKTREGGKTRYVAKQE
jgi:N-acetylmuramoyl-L-alanine amidase